MDERRISPKKYYDVFRPLPWQIPVLQDTSLYVLLDGTAGGGKTKVALEKAHLYAMTYPESSILFVRKEYATIHSTMLSQFLNSVVKGDGRVRYKKNERQIAYSNGSVIFLAGMLGEKESDRIKGIGLQGGLDFIVVDEYSHFTREDHHQLSARLRSRAGGYPQLLACTNPASRTHWIYQDLIATNAAHRYWSSYKENTHNPHTYHQVLDGLSGVMRERLRDGQWVSAEGAVYPEFSRETHVIRPFYIPPHWRRIRSIDFGYNMPFVCQWWAICPDGVMYMYREIYQTKLLVEDAARKICELSKGENIECTIRDHDSEDAATLHRHGVPNTPAAKFKTKAPAIQSIKQRLSVGGNQKARIYFFEGALISPDASLLREKKLYSTIQEMDVYAYEPTKNDISKEEPIKKDDHGMDAMRYAVTYIDNLSERNRSILSADDVRQIESTLQGLSGPSRTIFF